MSGDKLTVTQHARDAAALLADEVLSGWCHIGGNDIPAIRNGFWDDDHTDLGLLVKAFARFESETIARTNTTTELVEALRGLLARQGHSEPMLADGRKLSDDTIVTILCTTGDIRRARKALNLHDRGERE
jgi:hypothetical protein